jgi:hypothetical protein
MNISRSDLVRYVVGSYDHSRVTAIRHVEVGAWITSCLPTNWELAGATRNITTISPHYCRIAPLVRNCQTFYFCSSVRA